MTNEIRNSISLRWLKEKKLYQRWKNNIIKNNTLHHKAWLKNSELNKYNSHNIIQFGFNWSSSNEGHYFWELNEQKLFYFLMSCEQNRK